MGYWENQQSAIFLAINDQFSSVYPMTSEIIDALLQGMAESHADVSDLIFTTGKPPLVESGGRLLDFPVDTPGAVLDSRRASISH